MGTNYQHAKALLKERADFIKKENPTDKPLQREVINNHLDFLCRNYQFSEYQRNLLSNYACKLHPKNKSNMIPTINTKVISNSGFLGKVIEVTKNRITIEYESGNQTNIHLSKFPKMFMVV